MTAPARLIAHPIRMDRAPGEPPKAPREHPEDDFRHLVEKRLTACGWLWCHFPDSRRVEGKRGAPDDLAVRDGRILFIEYKIPPNRLMPGQVEWRAALLASGRVEHYVWTPDDWATILRAIA